MIYKKSLGLLVSVTSVFLILVCVPAASGLALRQDDGDEQGVTPLMRAVRDGEGSDLRNLLKQRVDLNTKDPYGWTALMYAAIRGDDSVVKALLNRGADIHATDNRGNTALIHAASSAHDSIVNLLLDKGADVNAKNVDNATALSMASGPYFKKVADILKEAGGIDSNPDAKVGQAESQPAVDIKPVPLNRPKPSYTDRAREEKVEGTIRARVLVDEKGDVKRVRIVRGLPAGMSYQARDAIYQIKFKPAMKDGQPVKFWIPVDVDFNLRKK